LVVEARALRFVEAAQLLAQVVLRNLVVEKALSLVLVAERNDGNFGVAGIGAAVVQALVAVFVGFEVNAGWKYRAPLRPVVGRLELLDEVRLVEQRHQLRAGQFVDVDALAHVNDLARLVVEVVHARFLRQRGHFLGRDERGQQGRFDGLGHGRDAAGAGLFGGGGAVGLAAGRGQRIHAGQGVGVGGLGILSVLRYFQQAAKQDGRGFGIAGGAVPDVLAELAQAVTRLAGYQAARKAHGAQRLARIVVAQVGKLLFKKGIVKAHVVGHKHAAFGHLHHLAGHFVKARRIGHHVVGDARELGDKRRN
nr:hypothetical protein [Tanacetum cinerariifolium]